MNQSNTYSFKKYFIEGILYTLTCIGVGMILSFLGNFILQLFIQSNPQLDDLDRDFPIYFAVLFYIPYWLLSSFAFAKFRGKEAWYIDTARFMIVGLFNSILIVGFFVLYALNAEHLKEAGLDVIGGLFMALWNFFSGGSSKFFIALISLFPTIIVFLLILAIFSFGLNALLYTVTKPFVDMIFRAFLSHQSPQLQKDQ